MNFLGHKITFKQQTYGRGASAQTFTRAFMTLDGKRIPLGIQRPDRPGHNPADLAALEAAVSAALLQHRTQHGEPVPSPEAGAKGKRNATSSPD